jgi:general nucleoside transport system permease protein
VQPTAPRLQDIAMGGWSSSNAIQAALRVNHLFFVGLLLALLLTWALRATRWGMQVRAVGDSAAAAKALGLGVIPTRIAATAVGSALAGIGGSFLSLYYPGSWNEALSSGQGVMAVALVIFARWHPMGCFGAALLFGAASSVGPALQAVGIQEGYHLWNAAPYVLTLLVMLLSSSPTRALRGAPGELPLMR